MAKSCPHPEKVAHATEAAALKHRNGLRYGAGASPDLVAYLCRCGAWHVGHSREHLDARIKRSLRPKIQRKRQHR